MEAGTTQVAPGRRLAPPSPLLVGVALALAVIVGVAMAYEVALGIAAVAAILYAPLIFLNVRLAVVVWIPSVSLVAAGLGLGPTLAGALIIGGWFGMLATRRAQVAALVVEHAKLLLWLAALIGWVLFSAVWAPSSPIGTDEFFSWLVAGAIVLVISTTLTDRRYLRLAAGAFVFGVVVSVILGLSGDITPEGDTARVVGGSGDPNFLAAGIVPAVIIAAGLAAGSSRFSVKLTLFVSIGVMTIGFAAAQSRGGFVAAIVGAIAVFVLAKRQRASVVGLLLCIVGVAGAWFSVDSEAWQRITDFDESTGRTELWTVAWQEWKDNPIAGVGLEGFRAEATGYVRELGPLKFSEFVIEQPKLVHNTYLELLAEAGIIGLALYLTVVAGALRRAWRAAGLFERAGDLAMAGLARSTIAAVIAMLASSFFISGATDRRFWLLIALGPALLACAGGGAAYGQASLGGQPPGASGPRASPDRETRSK
jgi:O-antigen ligase